MRHNFKFIRNAEGKKWCKPLTAPRPGVDSIFAPPPQAEAAARVPIGGPIAPGGVVPQVPGEGPGEEEVLGEEGHPGEEEEEEEEHPGEEEEEEDGQESEELLDQTIADRSGWQGGLHEERGGAVPQTPENPRAEYLYGWCTEMRLPWRSELRSGTAGKKQFTGNCAHVQPYDPSGNIWGIWPDGHKAEIMDMPLSLYIERGYPTHWFEWKPPSSAGNAAEARPQAAPTHPAEVPHVSPNKAKILRPKARARKGGGPPSRPGHINEKYFAGAFLISLTSKFQKGRQDLYQLKFDSKILLYTNRTEKGYHVMKDVITALQDNKVLDECCCSFETEF